MIGGHLSQPPVSSVTNTIVSMGHMGRKQEFERAFAASTVHDFFNFLAVLILFPIQYMTNFLGILAEKLAVFFHGAGGLIFTSPLKLIITPVTESIVGLAQNEPLVVLIVGLICLFTALKVIASHLETIAPSIEGLLQGFVGTEYEDTQQAVVSVLYARYLKRISAHLMDIACTSTSTPYHMMKKKNKD
ncbi:MAG: hypothetical protein GY807_08590 [Gammaproteobacteria bacterium]|nr:hypothetical protein [Gammaproteobacteria bacterium]